MYIKNKKRYVDDIAAYQIQNRCFSKLMVSKIHTHVHVYVYVYVCTTYVHVYMNTYACTYLHTYIHTFIRTYTQTHMSNIRSTFPLPELLTSLSFLRYGFVQLLGLSRDSIDQPAVCMYIYIYIYIHICVCVSLHNVYTCIYVITD